MDKIPRHLCASLWGDEEFEWRESPAKMSVDYFAFGIKKSWWSMLHLLGRLISRLAFKLCSSSYRVKEQDFIHFDFWN